MKLGVIIPKSNAHAKDLTSHRVDFQESYNEKGGILRC